MRVAHSGGTFGLAAIAAFRATCSSRCDSRVVTCSNPAVHASRFEIVGLKSGQVRTRFEAGRTRSAEAGAFSDDFDGLQPHVYDLPAP
jgi:hypothetical protein